MRAKTGGVVVASAGLSRRTLGGIEIGARILGSLEAAGAGPVVLVTDRVSGFREIAPRAERTFYLPADVPLFSPGTARALLDRFDRGGCDAVLPTHLGRRGWPILLDCGLVPELARHRGPDLPDAIEASGARVETVPVRDRGCVEAGDTPEGLRLLELLVDPSLPPHIRRHMEATAVLAVGFGQALNRRGWEIDLFDLELASLLHDVARLEPRHWDRGADLLLEAGRPEPAHMVRNHMDPEPGERDRLSPTTLLFLADKYIKEDGLVTLEERYQKALDLPPGPQRDHAWGNYQLSLRLTEALAGALGEPLTPERLAELADARRVYG